ncbi:SUMF1/EgtB/PvdO family nonheme iron enzyme [bacterium]|nr:SUMF1/EgtB/PvdO family nonheme iron enzyme [bacterium]
MIIWVLLVTFLIAFALELKLRESVRGFKRFPLGTLSMSYVVISILGAYLIPRIDGKEAQMRIDDAFRDRLVLELERIVNESPVPRSAAAIEVLSSIPEDCSNQLRGQVLAYRKVLSEAPKRAVALEEIGLRWVDGESSFATGNLIDPRYANKDLSQFDEIFADQRWIKGTTVRRLAPENIKGFFMSNQEVDCGLFAAVMHRSCIDDDLPVTNVSYVESLLFCIKLSDRLGRAIRLPTVAEWELAAGGKGGLLYSFGSDVSELPRYANFLANSNERLAKVKSRLEDSGGFFDLHGNVEEMTMRGGQRDAPALDKPKAGALSTVITKGGSFQSDAGALIIYLSNGLAPFDSRDDVGFRIVAPN